MLHTIVFLMLLTAFGVEAQQGVTIIPAANGRQTVKSQVGSLICTLDNIGGAVVTVHVICKVPAGYVLLTTTTPRFLAGAGLGGGTPPRTIETVSRGGYTDELGNTIKWRLWQEIKGVTSYSLTDSQSKDNSGWTAGYMSAIPALVKIHISSVMWWDANLLNCGVVTRQNPKFVVSQILMTDPSIETTDDCWPVSYARRAWNLIQAECARCHGNDLVPGKVDGVGNLDLRTRGSMLKGGGRGPAITVFVSRESLMWLFVKRPQFPTATPEETLALTTTNEESLGMPPFFPLNDEMREWIRQWIDFGAPVFEVIP